MYDMVPNQDKFQTKKLSDVFKLLPPVFTKIFKQAEKKMVVNGTKCHLDSDPANDRASQRSVISCRSLSCFVHDRATPESPI